MQKYCKGIIDFSLHADGFISLLSASRPDPLQMLFIQINLQNTAL